MLKGSYRQQVEDRALNFRPSQIDCPVKSTAWWVACCRNNQTLTPNATNSRRCWVLIREVSGAIAPSGTTAGGDCLNAPCVYLEAAIEGAACPLAVDVLKAATALATNDWKDGLLCPPIQCLTPGNKSPECS